MTTPATPAAAAPASSPSPSPSSSPSPSVAPTPSALAALPTPTMPIPESTTATLHGIWDRIGVAASEREHQLQLLQDALRALLSAKVQEEEALMAEYEKETTQLREDIRIASERTATPLSPEALASLDECEGQPLIKQLTTLRQTYNELDRVKTEMLDEIGELRAELHTLWGELGVEPAEPFLEPGFHLVKSREAFQDQLVKVRQDRLNRYNAIKRMMADIACLFEELDVRPASQFDAAIERSDPEAVGLTDETVDALSQRARELTQEKQSRTERLRELGKKIQPLWDRLQVAPEERQAFFAKNEGLGKHVLEECEQELSRLYALKADRMQELIADAQSKVEAIWEQLHVPQAERVFPSVPRGAGVDEDAELVGLERLAQSLEARLETITPLMRGYERYQELVLERVAYEKLIADPTRLLSRKRGSALVEEEQQRKRVTKELPRLVETLSKRIAEYEAKHGPWKWSTGERVLTSIEKTEEEHAEAVRRRREERKANNSSSSSAANDRRPFTSKNNRMRAGSVSR